MRIAIAGITGRMGAALLHVLPELPNVSCVYAFQKDGAEVGEVRGIRLVHPEACDFSNLDGVIDFSSPEGTCALLDYTRAAGVFHVIGTTGFSSTQKQKIVETARDIPVVFSGNFSVGIALLEILVEKAARMLGPEFDIEILEMHHRHKVDAPSGTALMLGQAAARGRGVSLEEKGTYVRHGQIGARAEGTIGFATLRGGGVVGDHHVILGGLSEQIELSHRAHSREMFARGALKAAQWVFQKPAGYYTMSHVLSDVLREQESQPAR